MRVLVAGGTGVIGRQLVPLLVDGAHEVTVVARSTRRAASVDGAQVAVADALDRDALRRVVEAAAPEAVVNLLTALPQKIDPIRIERQLRQTNRLRTLGTANLYDVARTAGVRQIVAEGLGWVYPPSSDVQDESVPLWLGAPKRFRAAAAALDELERRTLAAPGAVVLRFGHLYGPGTAWAADGTTTRQIRKRRLPIIGEGRGVFSFVHVTDAARAIVAALGSHRGGTFNIVDDDPAAASEWVPELASLVGAKPPRRIPAGLARHVVGEFGLHFLTAMPGASNATAYDVLGWRPMIPSWREGFRLELG